MEANEAPEKVYLHLTTGSHILNGKYYEYKPAKIRYNDKIIEYTRTDAFVEKACEWLKSHSDYLRIHDNGKGVRFDMTQCVIDFCRAMKVE